MKNNTVENPCHSIKDPINGKTKISCNRENTSKVTHYDNIIVYQDSFLDN